VRTHSLVILRVSAALPLVKLDIPKGALAMRPTRATALLIACQPTGHNGMLGSKRDAAEAGLLDREQGGSAARVADTPQVELLWSTFSGPHLPTSLGLGVGRCGHTAIDGAE
jgi:hypothetical protein